MLPIASLLNPSPTSMETRRSDAFYQVESMSQSLNMAPPAKKAKMTKDAIVLVEGKVKGQIVYPPCEGTDDKIAAEHRRLELHPMGLIAKYHRHIPYTSEKKSFLSKTGRESFEVFQYSFKIPGYDKVLNVMWDYNIGLVRMTPFFKACGYPKTQPAKMMSHNPGLRDISHSITGGALAAQGYWVPYAAAKAAALTFCYPIRYALTPLFGLDFPQMCIRTSEEGFGSMAIDPKIIRECTEQAARYFAMENRSSGTSTPETGSPSCFDSSLSTPPSSPSSKCSLRSELGKRRIKAKRKNVGESDTAKMALELASADNSTKTNPKNPYLKHLNKPYFEPDYQLSRPSVHKWEARSPSPRSSCTEATPPTKNVTIKNDHYDDSNDEYSPPALPLKLAYVAPVSKKRKRCFEVTAEDHAAAHALLELTNRDATSYAPRRASY